MSRFLGNGNAWVDQERFRIRGWQLTCSLCGTKSRVISNHRGKGAFPPDILTKKFGESGWFVGTKETTDECPDCYSKPKSRFTKPAAAPPIVGTMSASEGSKAPAPQKQTKDNDLWLADNDAWRLELARLDAESTARKEAQAKAQAAADSQIAAIAAELAATASGKLINYCALIIRSLDENEIWDKAKDREHFGCLVAELYERVTSKLNLLHRANATPSKPAPPINDQGSVNRSMLAKLRQQIGANR